MKECKVCRMRVTDEAIKCSRCGSKDLYKLRDSDIKIPVVDSSAKMHRTKYKDVKVAGEKDIRPKDNAKTSGITKKAYKKVEIIEQPEVMEQFCDELGYEVSDYAKIMGLLAIPLFNVCYGVYMIMSRRTRFHIKEIVKAFMIVQSVRLVILAILCLIFSDVLKWLIGLVY